MKLPKIENISVNAIKPYWRNARKNDKTIEALKQSIQEYGFNQPIVIDKDHVIIVGHSRYKAAIQLGIKKVPCIITDLTDVKAKEYRIADNKVHELSEWDTEKLLQELRELPDLGKMDFYFPDITLSDIISESTGSQVKPITQADIEAASNKADQSFTERSNQVQNSYRELACPHCGEKFSLTEQDIKTALN